MAYPRCTTVGVWRCVRESTTSMKSFAVGTCGEWWCRERRKRSVIFRERSGGETMRDAMCAEPMTRRLGCAFRRRPERRLRKKEPRRRRRRLHFSIRAAESRGGSTHRGDLLEVILHARHGCFCLPRAPLEGWAGACLAVPRARAVLHPSRRRRFSLGWQREAADATGMTMCMDVQ